MEELNKYLSRLSEHHDMYVLRFEYSGYSFLSKDTQLTRNAGRKLDPVNDEGKLAAPITSSCLMYHIINKKVVVYSYFQSAEQQHTMPMKKVP